MTGGKIKSGGIAMCEECQRLQRLNAELAERLAAASYVLSRAAERNGLVREVERLQKLLEEMNRNAEREVAEVPAEEFPASFGASVHGLPCSSDMQRRRAV